MRCLGCGAEVDWGNARGIDRSFECPECGTYRPSRNARPRVRLQAGQRDGWVCHRCELPVDPTVTPAPNHPLAAVADHYPIPRDEGGPPILANVKIAHSLCNGSSYIFVRALYADRMHSGGPLMAIVPQHRESADVEPRLGPATVQITPSQQAAIDVILELAVRRGGLPLARRLDICRGS